MSLLRLHSKINCIVDSFRFEQEDDEEQENDHHQMKQDNAEIVEPLPKMQRGGTITTKFNHD